jgi:hypothetical protein
MKKLLFGFLFLFVAFCFKANAQAISINGQFGWSIPNGEAFTYDEDAGSFKGGLGFTGDILYHFAGHDNKLAAGLAYNGAVIFGGGSSDGSLSLGLYSLELFGVKGYYNFFKSKVTPFASLSLGVSRLSTPDVKSGDELIAEGVKSYGLGVAPEIGVKFGGFTISGLYYPPMKYKTWSTQKETAGQLQILLGYRYVINFKKQ